MMELVFNHFNYPNTWRLQRQTVSSSTSCPERHLFHICPSQQSCLVESTCATAPLHSQPREILGESTCAQAPLPSQCLVESTCSQAPLPSKKMLFPVESMCVTAPLNVPQQIKQDRDTVEPIYSMALLHSQQSPDLVSHLWQDLTCDVCDVPRHTLDTYHGTLPG